MSAPEVESETAPKKARKPAAGASPSEPELPDASQVLEAVRTEVLHQVEVRPYTTVLVAAGLGYVIGAGAPRWASSLAWTLGTRAVLARVLSAL